MPKISISYKPTFAPASKTLDFGANDGTYANFTAYNASLPFVLSKLYAIINITTNKIIYNPTSAALNGTLADQVLTLTYDTTAMSSSDLLMILYDVQIGIVTADAINSSSIVSQLAMIYNGTTYDRTRSVGSAQATTGLGISAIGPMAIYNTTTPTITNGQYSALQLDSSANLLISKVSPPGIATGQITIGTTATLIAAARSGRKSLAIVQASATTAYLGGSSVTTSTGVMLAGSSGVSVSLDYQGAIYGIVASGTASVSFVETF